MLGEWWYECMIPMEFKSDLTASDVDGDGDDQPRVQLAGDGDHVVDKNMVGFEGELLANRKHTKLLSKYEFDRKIQNFDLYRYGFCYILASNFLKNQVGNSLPATRRDPDDSDGGLQ